MIKKIILFILLIPVLASAQDCYLNFTISGTGTAQFDNRAKNCLAWGISYTVTNGTATALSMAIQGAPDASTISSPNVPGSFTTLANTPTSGSNPLTNLTGDSMVIQQFSPWLQVNVTTATGTFSIQGTLYGYRAATQLVKTGGGSYTLPTASASVLGGVKVGSGLSIAAGVLSATGTGSPGGTSGQTQYNNAGAFGGYTPSGDFTIVPGTGVATVKGVNSVLFSGLSTGLLKNTTTTGVPSIAVAGTDYQLPSVPNANNAGIGVCSSGPPQLFATATTSGNPTCLQVPYSSVSGTPTSLPPSGAAGGDLTGSFPNPVVSAVNGTTVPTNSAADQVIVTTAAATSVWKTITNCVGSPNALNYSTTTHLFTCQAITATATPGGTNGQEQFNNSGALGGFTSSGDETANTSTGVRTVIGTNGLPLPVSAAALATNSSSQVIPATTVLTATTGTPQLVINSARTYYICPAALTTCVYNGTSQAGATPSDSNAGLTMTLPFATIGKVATVLQGAIINAVVTIQLANAATTNDYLPINVIFSPAHMAGGVGKDIFYLSRYAIADTYPVGMIQFQGDLTTPGNVIISGAATGGGTTISTFIGINLQNGNYHIAGIRTEYFGGSTVGFPGTGFVCSSPAVCYVDTMVGQGQASAAVSGALIIANGHGALVRMSGTITLTDLGLYFGNNGASMESIGPAGALAVTATLPNYASTFIECNESGHIIIYGPSISINVSGAGTYVIYQAQQHGSISIANDFAPAMTLTVSSAANSTIYNAAQGGFIYSECPRAGIVTCTFSGFGTKSRADDGGVVEETGGTQGTSADALTGDATVTYGPFSGSPFGTHQVNSLRFTNTTTALAPPVSLASKANIYYDSTLQIMRSSINTGAYMTMPQARGSVADLSRTATLGATTLLTGLTGLFQINIYTSTNSTVCTMAPTITYTDRNGAQTYTPFAATGTIGQAEAPIEVVSGNVQYILTVAGACTGGTGFDTQITATRLQ